ncbi:MULTISPECIES: SRPBCC family protein [Alteromonadaceae]|uniref:SRPBCC family protein n=1 Tax=Alteromonadaceae TaxID=72275 RepID=UPI001C085D15|nr:MULTISPECIES: SRPBCC family protein [Aliiglaciecola]MBU2876962.1 SRPBCC family protein [Aliiglaciecola lipolytica]MDO6712343.1 SRPBCC family protein [Aliiglaciecola sp. 2_MG-2023]MDO6753251.1 SRPBCC family protein [Aliiglaciecola sp. 1_MG-2023]
MAALKKIVFAILILLTLFIVFGYFLPSEYRVQRSITINASADNIYPQVADLKQWRNWGVWYQRDPDMQVEFSGDSASIGMQSSWQSVSEGDGIMTISALEPSQSVTYELYFSAFDMTSQGQLTFQESNGQTLVTWIGTGDVGLNPINRYFALAMDSLIGPDLQQGLENLKGIMED